MKNYKFPSNIDLSKSILWQYNSALRLQKIIALVQDATNASSVDLWKKMFFFFDLDKKINETDSDYDYRAAGLKSLSMLFGVDRPIYSNNGQSRLVSIDVWRKYLKGMIWLMDSNGSCQDINKWLSIIFPSIHAYVIDNLDMTIVYKFYPLPQEDTDEWQLINIPNFMPHPAGVYSYVNLNNSDSIFGTEGQRLGQLNHSRMFDNEN